MSNESACCPKCGWVLYDGHLCQNKACEMDHIHEPAYRTEQEKWDWIANACAKHHNLQRELAVMTKERDELRDNTSLLYLLFVIRAAGDVEGKLMLSELIQHITDRCRDKKRLPSMLSKCED